MTRPCFSNRSHWLRPMCSLLCILLGCCAVPSALPQNLEKPIQSIDEEITAFAYAPDGRIVYSVYRKMKTKIYDALEHDDIWIQNAGGKRQRLLDDSGKEIHINKGDSVISDAANASWLPDNATIAYLSESVKPRLLFSLKFTRPAVGALHKKKEGRTFREIAWLPGVNSAIAVEQDHNLTGPCRLQRLD